MATISLVRVKRKGCEREFIALVERTHPDRKESLFSVRPWRPKRGEYDPPAMAFKVAPECIHPIPSDNPHWIAAHTASLREWRESHGAR